MGTPTDDGRQVLSTADRTALITELRARLPREFDLDYFLATTVGDTLEMVAVPGLLKNRILDVVRAAERQGWIGDLIRFADQEWPGRPVLQRLSELLPPEHPPRTVSGDLSTYDMTEQVTLVRQALYDGRGMLVGVVVEEVGNDYLTRLYERVAGDLGASRRDAWLKLDVGLKSAADLATDVRRSVRTLASKPLVVGIRVARNSVAHVAPLLAALEPGSEKWAKHLVVILTADPSDIPALPATITRLNPPKIKKGDVVDWVDRLVADFAGWPFTRSQKLVTTLYQRASTSTDCWTTLYAEMDSVVIGLQHDFDDTVRAIDDQTAA